MDKLHDLRGQGTRMPTVVGPDRYGAAQDLGRSLHASGNPGIAYGSVRTHQGQCVAVFKPRVLGNAREAGHIGLHWNGNAVSHGFEECSPHEV